MNLRMAGTGGFTGEEEFAFSGGLKHFAVDVARIVDTGTEEREST